MAKSILVVRYSSAKPADNLDPIRSPCRPISSSSSRLEAEVPHVVLVGCPVKHCEYLYLMWKEKV